MHVIFHAEDERESFFGLPQIWDNTLKNFGYKQEDYSFHDHTKKQDYKNDPNLITSTEHFQGTPVYLSVEDGVDLKDFEHPEDAVYIFGRDGGMINGKERDKIPEGALKVHIKGAGPLWAIQACAIVLYDRKTKLK